MLCRHSPKAEKIFVSSQVQVWTSALDVNARTLVAHPELAPAKLLGLAFALEKASMETWRGKPLTCPDVVALRFLLGVLGPARARSYIETIRSDRIGQYEAIDERQLRRYQWLL